MRLSLLLPLVLLACGGDVGIVVPKEGASDADSGADGGEDGGAEPVDLDGDGHVAEDDCDDTNSDIFPGAPEVADDGIDQDCDGVDARTIYGHRDDTDNTALVENYLIGNIIALDAPLHVTHAGLTVREAFGEVRLGIYASDGGRPAELLASTGSVVAEVGVMEVPLETAVTLPAGDVWVQLVASETVPIAVGPDELVFYKDHDFATPLPDPYGVGSDYEGPRMSLFILGTLPE